MEWKEEFSVGIPEIDKEHQVLTRCATDIENAVTKGEPTDKVNAAIERLLFCIRVHFSGEEHLMRTVQYPHLEAHAKEHQDFLLDVKEIVSSGAPVSAETLEYLRKSLEKHFMADEKDYGVFVLSRSARHGT